MRAWARQEQYG